MNASRILIVDDNETWLKVLTAIYVNDYEVITAKDGAEALEVLLNHPIDLVISDILMPNLDGYNLSYKIRTNEKLKDIPIIIHAATYTAATEEQAVKEMGANVYIRKPAPVELLYTVAKEILAEPHKYPHLIPSAPAPAQPMRQYNEALVSKLKQSYIDLEVTKAKLEYSESRLKEAQAIAGIGSRELDFATNISVWSDEACRIHGLSSEDNLQTPESFLSFIHPDDLDYVTRTIDESRATLRDNSYYHRILRDDGEIRHIHAVSKFRFDSEGHVKGMYGICHDITETKDMESELRKSETNLRSIFNNTEVGFLLTDADFKVILANTVVHQWAKKQMSTTLAPGMDFRQVLLPEKLQEFDEMMAITRQKKQVSYDASYPDTEGGLSWFHISAKPVLEAGGAILGICLAVSDITEKKESEIEIATLNETLEQRVQERTITLSESNNALEAFSYSVSHDLLAPVRVVTGFAQIIRDDFGDKMSPELKELFGHIDDSSRRMDTIIRDLLKLAKYGKEQLKIVPVNMMHLIKGIWSNMNRTTTHRALLELADLPVIKADMSMMEQVVINLLSNAIKYSSKNENPIVKVWCEQTKEDITFFFKDNGVGFDMEHYHRLFGAFQRFHGVSEFEGTGVGLTIVKNIIEKHGGTVAAESIVGEGATFHFTLPIV